MVYESFQTWDSSPRGLNFASKTQKLLFFQISIFQTFVLIFGITQEIQPSRGWFPCLKAFVNHCACFNECLSSILDMGGIPAGYFESKIVQKLKKWKIGNLEFLKNVDFTRQIQPSRGWFPCLKAFVNHCACFNECLPSILDMGGIPAGYFESKIVQKLKKWKLEI